LAGVCTASDLAYTLQSTYTRFRAYMVLHLQGASPWRMKRGGVLTIDDLPLKQKLLEAKR